MANDPIYIGVIANLDDDGFSRRKAGDWSAHINRNRTELIELIAGMAYKYNKESGRPNYYKAYVGVLTEEVTFNSVASARWPKPAPPKSEPMNSPGTDDDIPF